MTLNADVRKFFDYLNTCKRRFFGIDMLTLPGFVSIYLNYDTDYNPFRLAILNCSLKSEKAMTVDCLNFIKQGSEKGLDGCFLNNDDLLKKGVKVSKELNSVLEETFKHSFGNIHEFMRIVLTTTDEEVHTSIVSYFKTVFEVEFEEMIKISEVYFENIEVNEEIHIPKKLAQIVTVIDGKRDNYKLLVGDDYKDNIWGDIQKFETNNLIMIADHIDMIQKYVYNMAYELAHDISCPTRREIILVEIDMQAVIQNAVFDEDGVKAIQSVVDDILSLKEKDKLVLYIKNYNVLLKNRNNGFSYVFYTYPLFQDEEVSVIIDMDDVELKSVISNNRFMEFFELLFFDSPNKDEIVPYLFGQLVELIMHHGVYADGKNIEETLLYVKALNYGGNVNGTKSLLDYVMAFANSQGRNQIFESDYVEHFKINFHDQEKQNDEYKQLVAYHEAGHFVVSRFCEHYKAIYSDLISTVSVADMGGVNIMEEDTTLIGSNDYNFYLDSLALLLAGRASEEIFLTEISAGAVSDLEQATKLATAMIVDFGLDKSKKIKGNENMLSERARNEVSDKVNDILSEAYTLAIDILQKHEKYVHSLAKKLIEKRIISRKEILSLEVAEGDDVYLK